MGDAFQALICAGAPTAQFIAQALSRNWVDDFGKRFTSTVTAAYDYQAEVNALSNTDIISELTNNRPMLHCNTHHATVLAVVRYVELANGGIQMMQAGVLDPFPGSPDYHALTTKEFTAIQDGGEMMFLGSVSINSLADDKDDTRRRS